MRWLAIEQHLGNPRRRFEEPRGRPAGSPDLPLANRPRRSRTPSFPCFIWSKSGITPSRSLTGHRYRRFLNGMNANIMVISASLRVQQ
jgi:hypothetical protein